MLNLCISMINAFHTRFVGPGMKGIIEMHRFNICLVVVLPLSCSGVKTPLGLKRPINTLKLLATKHWPQVRAGLCRHELAGVCHFKTTDFQ